MKKIFSVLMILIATVVFCAACNGSAVYEIYTNFAADEYKVTSNKFKVVAGLDEGVRQTAEEGVPAVDTSGFTTNKQSYYVMNFTEADLVVSDDFSSEQAQEKFDALKTEVGELLNEIENSLSISIETSCVYRFNEAEAGETIEIDRIAYEVLTIAENVYALTDGYYNPAVYYNEELYGFHQGGAYPQTAQDLPSKAAIESFSELAAHFGEIDLIESDGSYYAVKPAVTVTVDGMDYAMKIDLGGIGKGYAVDRIDALFDVYGFAYGYFNFGSSSMSLKKFYGNTKYSLSFTDPRPDQYGQTYMTTAVCDTCLSTSGDYEQFYEIDGVRYCHIIDPTTGSPVQTGIMTVTVIGGSAAEDDALTTAIMAMGKEHAIQFIHSSLTEKSVVFTYNPN